MVITFNHKEGTDTITFDDLKASAAAEKSGSDLDCLTAPKTDTNFDKNHNQCLFFCKYFIRLDAQQCQSYKIRHYPRGGYESFP